MLRYDDGILSAATAFGKTAVCSYLISQRKVNTLILLHSKDLLEQWVEELNKFLAIDEIPPTYSTKTGRIKRRNSAVGILHGNKNTLTGIIDVAMVGSMYGKGKFNELINAYGMVIMDECHHCGAATTVEVMRKINARYVYGVSATIKRGDNLEKIIYMLLGSIRHSFSAKERAAEQGIGHYVYPRYTRVVDTMDSKNNINKAYSLISDNGMRNDMIAEDTIFAVQSGRTPVILTRHKHQAKVLYDKLANKADFVFLLYGDNTDKENSEIRKELKGIPDDKSIILIATGQKIGEGFDYPRLDTLMLAAPVSFSGRLEQYIGRLDRDYAGKENVIVYDYVDSHVRYFDNMYLKRLKTYKRVGYSIVSNSAVSKQVANSIYDADNYSDVFERDIVEASKKIVVSSPGITSDKINRFLYLVKEKQDAGCDVTVVTNPSDAIYHGDIAFNEMLIEKMKINGVNVVIRETAKCFAVIDDSLVWHGGMNLLGKDDFYDNLIRINSEQAAAELLEIGIRS